MERGGQCDFFPSEMWKHVGCSHWTKIPNGANVNFTTILDKVFLLLRCFIVVISFQELWFTRVKAERTKANNEEHATTLHAKDRQRLWAAEHAASETNEGRTDCHQISISFSKVRYIFLGGIVCKWYIEYVRYNCKQTCNLHRLQSVPWSLFILNKKAGRPLGTELLK